MSECCTKKMRSELLEKFAHQCGPDTPLRPDVNRRLDSLLSREKVSSRMSPKAMLRGTYFLFSFKGVWGSRSTASALSSSALSWSTFFVLSALTQDLTVRAMNLSSALVNILLPESRMPPSWQGSTPFVATEHAAGAEAAPAPGAAASSGGYGL